MEKRGLKQCLNTTLSGCPVPAPPDPKVLYEPLDLTTVDQLWVVPSVFSKTRYVRRKLDDTELRLVWDLPQQGNVPLSVFRARQWPPLGLFFATLDLLAPQVGTPIPTMTIPCHVVDRRPPSPPVTTHFPLISRSLPHSWAEDRSVQVMAVKSDDAPVDFGLWDSRLLLLYPQLTPEALAGFRSLGLRWWRRSLVRSLLSYLAQTYGADWAALLRRARATLGQARLPGESFDTFKRRVALEYANQVHIGENMAFDPPVHDPIARLVLRPPLDDLVRETAQAVCILTQTLSSSWWDWSNGSSLFFWRWPSARTLARDGYSPRVRDGPLPQSMAPSRLPPKHLLKLLATKVQKVIDRGYLENGPVSNVTNYFGVKKGADDIRVVYDATLSGLNARIWSPKFYLPSAYDASQLLDFNYYMVDLDLGEMFLNFGLEESFREWSGIDLTPLIPYLEGCPETKGKRLLMRWTRLFMGFKPSPFGSTAFFYLAEEFARGDPARTDNPFHYTEVRLNLPGSPDFDPSFPFVMKWNTKAKHIAGDLVTFVDDLRASGHSLENAWMVARQVASRLQFLGIQEAPRKRRPPSREAGAWAGTIFATSNATVTKTLSQAKWDKGRTIVEEWSALCRSQEGPPKLSYKKLEQNTGFLNHLGMTFDQVPSYLKSAYLSMNSWRGQRNTGGWKMTDRAWEAYLAGKLESGELSTEEIASLQEIDEEEPPKEVPMVASFSKDVAALMQLFAQPNPPLVPIRMSIIIEVIFAFGDAAGSGFGSSLGYARGVKFRVGVWAYSESEESSNWREFTNVVETLEEEGLAGNLTGCLLFFFTDNSTVESAVDKGSSGSEKLHDLAVRFRVIETKFQCRLCVIHVAGKRMIAQGTDGVSRGDLNEGIMQGGSMLEYIPLHLSAVQRSPSLRTWVEEWCGDEPVWLDPKDWFQRGHDILGWKKLGSSLGFESPVISEGETLIWSPPPMAAREALAELRKARVKRQKSLHIFVCPRLCTTKWIRSLYKAADIVMVFPPMTHQPCWPPEMFEPVIVALFLPYAEYEPWEARGSKKMETTRGVVSRLWKDPEGDPRRVLRQLVSFGWRLPTMFPHLVRQLLLPAYHFAVPGSEVSRKRRRRSHSSPPGSKAQRR